MVRYNTVLGTDTKPKFQQKKSKVKVMYFSDGALPQPVIQRTKKQLYTLSIAGVAYSKSDVLSRFYVSLFKCWCGVLCVLSKRRRQEHSFRVGFVCHFGAARVRFVG